MTTPLSEDEWLRLNHLKAWVYDLENRNIRILSIRLHPGWRRVWGVSADDPWSWLTFQGQRGEYPVVFDGRKRD